jgi:type II secretory pathway component GspD/PulD (secretin)
MAMRTLRVLGTIGCVTALASVLYAQEQAAGPAQPARDLLFVPQHFPAKNLAEAIQQVLPGTEGVRVVAEPVSNAIFIHAPAEQIARVRDLLTQLDAPPAVIEVEVVILRTAAEGKPAAASDLSGDAEKVRAALASLEQAGSVEVMDRLRLTTLDNQIAQVRFGQKTFAPGPSRSFSPPSDPGRSFSPPSEAVRRLISFSPNEVGTTVTVTPRRSGDDVVAELAVEKSWLPPAGAAEDAGAAKPTATETLSTRATLRLPKGQSVLLGENDSTTTDGRSRTAVIVTARIAEPAKRP